MNFKYFSLITMLCALKTILPGDIKQEGALQKCFDREMGVYNRTEKPSWIESLWSGSGCYKWGNSYSSRAKNTGLIRRCLHDRDMAKTLAMSYCKEKHGTDIAKTDTPS